MKGIKSVLLIVFIALSFSSCNGCNPHHHPPVEPIPSLPKSAHQILIDSFSVSPLIGKAPLTVKVTIVAHISGEEYKGDRPLIYRIDFDGDGRWDFEGNPCLSVSYTYKNVGTYTLKAEIYNTEDGTTKKIEDRIITVNANKPPKITSISVSPREGKLVNGKMSVMLFVTAIDPDASSGTGIAKVTYDMDGDGKVDYEKTNPSSLDIEWTYTRVGEYTIIVKVYDADGASATARTGVRVYISPSFLTSQIDLDSFAYSVYITGPFTDRSILPAELQGTGLKPYYLIFLGESYGNVDIYYSEDVSGGDIIFLSRFRVLLSSASYSGGVKSMVYRDKCLLLAGGGEGSGEPYVVAGVKFSNGIEHPNVIIYNEGSNHYDYNIFYGYSLGAPNYRGHIILGSYKGKAFVAAPWFSIRNPGGGVNLRSFSISGCKRLSSLPFPFLEELRICPFDTQAHFCSKVMDVLYYKNHFFIAANKYGMVSVSMKEVVDNCSGKSTCYVVDDFSACSSNDSCVKGQFFGVPPYVPNALNPDPSGFPNMRYWVVNSLYLERGGWVADEPLNFRYDEEENGYVARVKYFAHVTSTEDAFLYRNGEKVPRNYWHFIDGKRVYLYPEYFVEDPWAYYIISYKKADLLFAGVNNGGDTPQDHHTVPLFIIDVTDPDNPVFLNKKCLEIPVSLEGSCELQGHFTQYSGDRFFMDPIYVRWPYAYTYGGNEIRFLPVLNPLFPFPSDFDWYDYNRIFVSEIDNWTDAGAISSCYTTNGGYCPHNMFTDIINLGEATLAANYYRGLSLIGSDYRIKRELNIGGIPFGFSPFKYLGREYVFVAKGYGGVDLYDINKITHPKVISHIDIDGEATGVYFDRGTGMLYVAGNNYGIYSFDYRNFRKPQLVSRWMSSSKIKRLDGDNSNFIFFCNDSSLPPVLFYKRLSDFSSPHRVSGSYSCFFQNAPIYVAKDRSNLLAIEGYLYSYDFSNPPRMTLLTRVLGSEVVDNYVDRNFLILATSRNVFIYDIFSPTSPYKISSINMNDYLTPSEMNRGGSINSIDKVAQYLFVSLSNVGLFVFDISKPEQPMIVGDIKGFQSTVMNAFVKEDQNSPGTFYYDAMLGSGSYDRNLYKIYFVRFIGLNPPMY